MQIIQDMIKERQAKAKERGILDKALTVLSANDGKVSSEVAHGVRARLYKDDHLTINSTHLMTGELCECIVWFNQREVFHVYVPEVSAYTEGVWEQLLDLVVRRAEHMMALKKIDEEEGQLRKDIEVMKAELEKWGI